MTSALLIVDVQNDFCEGGSLAVAGGAKVAADITEHVARTHYDFIIASKDYHIDPGEHFAKDAPNYTETWPRHCEIGTEGVEFHPNLNVVVDEVFYKGQYSAAYSALEASTYDGKQSLEEWLRERSIDMLYVCGIALDYCVKATVIDARESDRTVILLPNLTAAVDGANFDKILADLQRTTGCLLYVGD